MTDFRFSVILPTCGRWSLQHALRSIQQQTLVDGDEVLLVADGPQPVARTLFGESGLPGRYLETAPSGDFGGTQRNHGIAAARADYCLFMDDDDACEPDAFARIRAALREAPGRPHLFRMRYANGSVLWREPVLVPGNVSTQMIAFPNRPGALARWHSEY